jgi:hypothetical protein
MKKILLSISLLAALSISAFADTGTVTAKPGTYGYLLTGPIKVTQLVVTATTATNTAGLLIDSPTNTLTYTLSAYTNTVSYLTNLPTIYTNYFGVLSTNADSGGTNWVLVDVNQSVAASTNSYPTIGVASPASTATTINNMNSYFFRGFGITNNSSGNMSVTVTYQRQ